MPTFTKKTTPATTTSAFHFVREARWCPVAPLLAVVGDTATGSPGDANYARVLRRASDGTFTDLGPLPSMPTGGFNDLDGAAGIAYGAAWHPDGDHLAVGMNMSPYVHVYSRAVETFAKLSNPASLPTGQGQQPAFSPDGQFLAVAHVTTPFITVYARSGTTYTKLTNPGTLPAGNGISCAFSPDSQFLAVAHSTSPFVTVYAISGSGASATLTKLANPGTLPAGGGTGAAWSQDGTYLAIGHTTTPFLSVYKKSGTGASATLTKIANPANLPPSTVRELSWAANHELYCSSDLTPFHIIYDLEPSTDVLTKLSNLGTGPTALTYSAVIGPTSQLLAISGQGTPFLDLYETDRSLAVSGGGEFTATGAAVADTSLSVTGGGEFTATGQRMPMVRVAGATPGDEYRLYDSSNTLIATGIVGSQGTAVMGSLSLPITGYVQGYSGGSPITGDRWPASGSESIPDDRVFLAAPENLAIDGVDVIAYDAANYYPTSQYGGSSSQIIETADYRFITYRSGGLGESTTPDSASGDVKIVRWNKSTGAIDQGPVTIRANQWNGHEPFIIARAPNGKIRFVYGGWRNGSHTSDANGDVWFRESTSADDVSAWGAAVSIRDGHTVVTDRFEAFVYKVGSDGRNYIAGGTAGDDIEFGTAANGSTTWTWTTIGTARTTAGSRWGGLIGDMFVTPGTSPVRVGVCFGSYGLDETYEEAYRKTYYLESTDNFATARKADTTSVSLPFTWTSAGATSCDLVQDDYHYGYWLKMALWNGEPVILGDGERHTYGDYQQIIRWTGSAWVANDVPGLISNDTGFAVGAPSPSGPRFGNWGTSLLVTGSTIHVYSADRGDNSDQGFRILRWSSTDAFASTPVDLTIFDDDFEPFSYAELTETTRTGLGYGGAGFCYPKVPEGYPNTVLFSAVDETDSTVMVASWSDSGTVSVSGGGEMTATGAQTFGSDMAASGGGDFTATGGDTTTTVVSDLEGFVLDGLDLNSALYGMAEFVLGPPPKRYEWIANNDIDGSDLIRDPSQDNRPWTLKVRLWTDTRDEAQAAHDAIVAKLEKAERNGRDGITAVWTPVDSSTSYDVIVLSGETTDFPITVESGYFINKPLITFQGLARPAIYTAPVSFGPVTASTPLVTLELPDVPGQLPAELAITVTDAAGQARRDVTWGLEQLHYDPADPSDLTLDASDMTVTGYAGTLTTRAGSVGTNVVRVSDLPVNRWTAVCGLEGQPHIGVFRPRVRGYGDTSTSVRVSWRAGDGQFTAYPAVMVPAIGWFEIDLGAIVIPPAVLGAQSFDLRVEAISTADGSAIDVDLVELIPAGEGYGRARTVAGSDAAGIVNATDDFSAGVIGDPLNGATADAGGTWATSGATTDFAFSDGMPDADVAALRDTAVDEAGPRFAILGSTAYTDTDVALSRATYPGGVSWGNKHGAAVARYVDASNYAFAKRTPSGPFVLGYVLAGTPVTLQSTSIAAPAAAARETIELLIYASGRAVAWLIDSYGTVQAELEGMSTDLATGGALASGLPGFYDQSDDTVAVNRFYDSFSHTVPAPEIVTVNANQSIVFRHDTVLRENAAGTGYGEPGSYRGGPAYAPCAGDDDLTSRLVVAARRADVSTSAADHVTDSTIVAGTARPRFIWPA